MNRKAVAQELVRVAKLLSAGTWSMPNNKADSQKLLKLIKQMEKGEWPDDKTPATALYNVLGDDQLFDSFDREAKPYLRACADMVKRRIKQFAQQDVDEYSDPKDKEQLDWLDEQL